MIIKYFCIIGQKCCKIDKYYKLKWVKVGIKFEGKLPMCADYNDMLKRLIEERHRLSWSKKKMAQCVRMDQSNYSKVELGLRRLNYYELVHLCESDADVYYIYTGWRSTGLYKDFFCQCSYSELVSFLSVMHSIVLLRYRGETTEKWRNILDKLKYVPLIEDKQNPSDIFIGLRRTMDCQQKKMAEILGVDVRQLRDLEKERKFPDSELVGRLYELFHISPAAILRNKRTMESEISIFMELLDAEDRKKIYEIMQILHNMN